MSWTKEVSSLSSSLSSFSVFVVVLVLCFCCGVQEGLGEHIGRLEPQRLWEQQQQHESSGRRRHVWDYGEVQF